MKTYETWYITQYRSRTILVTTLVSEYNGIIMYETTLKSPIGNGPSAAAKTRAARRTWPPVVSEVEPTLTF